MFELIALNVAKANSTRSSRSAVRLLLHTILNRDTDHYRVVRFRAGHGMASGGSLLDAIVIGTVTGMASAGSSLTALISEQRTASSC